MRNYFFQMKSHLYTSTPKNYTGYVGVPAPEVLEYDEWFGHPPETEKSIAIKEAKKLEEEYKKLHQDIWKPEVSVEPDNIHQLMYDLATQNTATTLDLGWQSGVG